MKRYADTFFRNWLLIMIPVIVLPIGEYLLVRHPAPQVTAFANIYVTQPVSDGGNPFTTPAQVEAANLNEWLQSASFDFKVALTSPTYAQALAHVADPQYAAFTDLAMHFQVTAVGDHLVEISYQNPNGQLALQVVRGLLKTASATTLSISQWQQTIVGSYYLDKLRTAQQQEQQSAGELDDYIRNHGITPSAFPLEMDSDPTFANLYNRSKSDQQNVATLEQQVAASSGQSVSPITIASRQAYFVADQPSVLLTYSSKKKMLTYVVVALVLGVLVGGSLMVVLTAMDRTMRYASDVQVLLRLPVVAIVTHSPGLNRRDPLIAAKMLPGRQIAELEQTG